MAALGNPNSLAFTQSFTIEGCLKVNGLPIGYNGGSIMFRGDDRGGLDPYTLFVLPNGDLQFGSTMRVLRKRQVDIGPQWRYYRSVVHRNTFCLDFA